MAWHDGRAIRDFARPLKILSDVLSDRASSIFLCTSMCDLHRSEIVMQVTRKEKKAQKLTFRA